MGCDFPQHHGKGGGGDSAGLAWLVIGMVACAIVTPFIGAILHILMLVAAGTAVAAGAILALTVRRRLRRRAVDQSPLSAALSPARSRRQALPQQQDGGVHYHLHGMTPEALRHVLGQQDGTKWTASIENDGR